MLENSFNKYQDRIALSFTDNYTLTYSKLREKIETISSFLKDEGITKGDKIAIIGENHPNWAIVFFAVTLIGAIAVPVMQEFSPSEIEYVLKHSEAKIVFVSTKFTHKIQDSTLPDLKKTILLEDFSVLPDGYSKDFIKKMIEEGKKEFIKLKESAMKFVGLLNNEIEESDPASLIYTSGTTGHSKGVMLTHENLISNASSVVELVTLVETDRMLSILPLSHTFESTLGMITPLMAGAAVYYLDKPPTATSLLPALEIVKPTIMLSVPLIIEKMFKMRILPRFKKNIIIRTLYRNSIIRKRLHKVAGKKLMQTFGGQLRMFCIGGAPLAEDVERFLQETGFPYTCGYGLTETSPLVTGNPVHERRFRSVGQKIKGVEIKIENPDPNSGVGEILVNSPGVMKGYHNSPEKTKEVLSPDGWFRTGDLGCIDEEGYLYIKGRIKNMILGPNGKNLYPEELEAKLNESSYVLESLVYEKEGNLAARLYLDYNTLDEEFKEKGIKENEMQDEIKKQLKSIIDEVNQRVPAFSKIVHVSEQEEPFEKTPTLKIKRYLYI